MDHFFAAFFLLESTSEPMVEASEKIRLQILNLTAPSIHYPHPQNRNRASLRRIIRGEEIAINK
jgi:hypothetical protein